MRIEHFRRIICTAAMLSLVTVFSCATGQSETPAAVQTAWGQFLKTGEISKEAVDAYQPVDYDLLAADIERTAELRRQCIALARAIEKAGNSLAFPLAEDVEYNQIADNLLRLKEKILQHGGYGNLILGTQISAYLGGTAVGRVWLKFPRDSRRYEELRTKVEELTADGRELPSTEQNSWLLVNVCASGDSHVTVLRRNWKTRQAWPDILRILQAAPGYPKEQAGPLSPEAWFKWLIGERLKAGNKEVIESILNKSAMDGTAVYALFMKWNNAPNPIDVVGLIERPNFADALRLALAEEYVSAWALVTAEIYEKCGSVKEGFSRFFDAAAREGTALPAPAALGRAFDKAAFENSDNIEWPSFVRNEGIPTEKQMESVRKRRTSQDKRP